VLEDLSLSIRAGDVIAINGRTAAARHRWSRSSARYTPRPGTHPLGRHRPHGAGTGTDVQRRALFAELRGTLEGRAAVLNSHCYSTVRTADRIYVMREGRIPETGSHDSLMAV
jgi:hypothetical protein